MGEGNEQTPLAVITDAPIEFMETKFSDEGFLSMPPEDDIYKPVYTNL